MKKNNLKRKKSFSIKFMILTVLIIFIGISSSYAIFTQRLTIAGNIEGQAVFTYYFRKPDTWGSTINAHIWVNGGSAGTTWPGEQMEYVTTENGSEIYKIEVTEDKAFYSGHNFIIFNDGSNQTINIPINQTKKYDCNNKIFTVGSQSGKQILAFNRLSDWPGTKVYAYLWNNSTGTNIAAWPGIDITGNQISLNLYAIEVDKNLYDRIIFNNGSKDNGDFTNKDDKRQTGNLTIDFSDDRKYSGGWQNINPGFWSNYIPANNLTSNHSNN